MYLLQENVFNQEKYIRRKISEVTFPFQLEYAFAIAKLLNEMLELIDR